MYREDEFYYLTDRLHYDIYNVALRPHGIKEERVIVKLFKSKNEEILIESTNGINNIIKDTRKDKNKDIIEYDLVFLKSIDRYYSDYELEGMTYENIEGLGSWYRVKIEGFNPKDPDLKIFYNKKKVTKEMIENSDNSKEIKEKQLSFLNKIKELKFTSPSKVKKVLNNYK